MRNLTARDLGRPFIYFLTINEKFYKISFLSQILAMVIFCFPPISMKWTANGNICKLLFIETCIERYKWQTSYRTCIKFVLEKSVFATLLIFYFISCELDRRTQPCSIHLNSQPYHSDTRWHRLILYDPYFFKKIIDLRRSNDWQQRKTWVHLKLTEL